MNWPIWKAKKWFSHESRAFDNHTEAKIIVWGIRYWILQAFCFLWWCSLQEKLVCFNRNETKIYLTLVLCFLLDGKRPSGFLHLTRVGEDWFDCSRVSINEEDEKERYPKHLLDLYCHLPVIRGQIVFHLPLVSSWVLNPHGSNSCCLSSVHTKTIMDIQSQLSRTSYPMASISIFIKRKVCLIWSIL